jgi:hypothetical protein
MVDTTGSEHVSTHQEMKNRITVMLAVLVNRRKLRWCYVEEREFFVYDVMGKGRLQKN